jgi:hypothetical protein
MAHAHYIEVNRNTHKILRHGICAPGQVPTEPETEGNEIISVQADPFTQKFVDGEIVPKTEEDMTDELPEAIAADDQVAVITQGQLQDILDRLAYLESYSPAVPIRATDTFGVGDTVQMPVTPIVVADCTGTADTPTLEIPD